MDDDAGWVTETRAVKVCVTVEEARVIKQEGICIYGGDSRARGD